uniref:Coagulation factor VIII, procoagulant component n=1 Tax=Oryzias sinensis TaxID=183150 RepID=A0A8C7Z1X5_9TELE
MRQTLLFPLLLLLLCGSSAGEPQTPVGVREYYIAAVEIGWDYIHLDDASEQRVKVAPQKYIKAVYREYTDSTYTIPVARPAWAGIQGPTIITQAGHRVVVHFKNLASQSYSISPVGITYWKQSEGAGYDDSTAGQEKEDDAVSPGGQYEYVWDINPKDGPTLSDPECLTYSYSSQVDTVRDVNSGLMGALLICKSSTLRHPAFVLLLAVFDETQSWYGERMSREMFKMSKGRKVYHTINGYVNSTLPGLTMCHNHQLVLWHLIGMGTTPEIHSIRFQDHSLQVMAHRKVNLEVTSMSFITAEMKPTSPGRFLISCQLYSHRYDGMNAEFNVEKCPEPDVRHVKLDSKEMSDEDYASMFNTVHLQPPFQARSSREQSKTWKHFIAAEEIQWDYTPHLKPTDSVLQSRYLPAAPHHLGYKYKKVAFVEYTDASFTRRKNLKSTLLGPVLKGKVNDEIHIIFKNMASRPFNIYPNGLTKIDPLQRSSNGKNDLRSMGVPPNETFGYIWRLTTDDGPLKGDPQCLTQVYQSTFSPESDLASGLVGTLLICKYDAINFQGQLKLNLIFAVFDENKSWYFKDNMERSSQSSYNATEPGFYESNVIYSINGIMFSGRQFVMCQTDVIFWHVANVGTQSDFLSVYFTGNLFQRQSLYQSVLTLFPMTAETIPMETELIGEAPLLKLIMPGAVGGVDPRSGERRPRLYYIAAEEITWDYGIRTPHQEMCRGMRKFLPEYKKVVFRAYMDDKFERPIGRGELEEHLGIMGPFIGAEINELLTVTFKNKASRPYSFHLHGVYDGHQGTGMGQADSEAAPAGIPGEPVPPGEARTYNWKIHKKQGPSDSEFNCKTGAYYSTVDKEKDLHSGLIGPLVICKVGTLEIQLNKKPTIQDFSLLFHTFDETKSWYLQENLQKYCTPSCQANTDDPWYHTSNKFAAINGYVAETLPGLMVAQHQQVRWHLLNVGGDKEFHAVHFHGLPFTVHTNQEHRMGVFSLFPGVFGTVEMTPSTVGTWLVECTIGDYQLAGMRAKLLVYDPCKYCSIPLGMKSGWIKDSQITASDHVGKAGFRVLFANKIDLQKPTLLHAIETQGVRSRLRDHCITFFNISYSLDQETWKAYREYNSKFRMLFPGNMDSSKVRRNSFSPPFVARYIRIQPFRFVLKPALRLELLGCDINSCSLPLGLKNRIPDNNFTASSFYSSLVRSWSPSLARLHQTGGANAWRPKNNNPHEWLQVDLGSVKRITGVITQGARSVLTEMMVTEFSVTYSQDEHTWSSVLEDNSQREKIFTGNSDVDEEALNFFDPPLFGRYVRIHPRGWFNDIALRLELLGCVTQPGV